MQDGMFYRIRDFAYARTARQALGFYLFHLLIGMLGFVLAVASYKLLVGFPEGDATLLSLSKVSSAVALLYVGYLNYKLLEAKNRLGFPKIWAFFALGLVLSLAGMLLGLVVTACFSILRPLPVANRGEYHFSEKERP
jgi:hypothetical protein